MQSWRLTIFILSLSLSGFLANTVYAQGTESQLLFSKYRHFRIPFSAGPGKKNLRQLQLFYSTDNGDTWQPSSIVPPEQKHFRFLCDRDGLYWFSVQTQDKDGKYFPESMDNAEPSLKVLVDTLPPEVQIQPLIPRRGQVGVSWTIKEEHLDLTDPKSVRLEYRVAGAFNWNSLLINRATNRYYWTPDTNAPLEVRIKVFDRAENYSQSTTRVSLNGDSFTPNPNSGSNISDNNSTLPNGYSANARNRRLVNSKRIRLNYELTDVGPSDVSAIQLWLTQDGRGWDKVKEEKGRQKDLPNPLLYEVDREGVFGFTLLAKSGVGLGIPPPRVGDAPQIWVEVDLQRPFVQLQNVLVGRGVDKGKLSIYWNASDKNLGKTPITLSYAKNSAGPWTTIARNVSNTGTYIWNMPGDVPYQFLVRVEATDDAGNVGQSITRDLVKVDLSQPKVNILGVNPAGGN